MTNRIKKSLIVILSCIMLVAVCALALPFTKQASASTPAQEFTADSFTMKNSASVRVLEPNGIRFKTVVGTNTLSSWGDNFTLGTLVIPVDILTQTGKTVDDLTVGATFTSGEKEAKPVNVVQSSMTSWSKDAVDQNANYKVFNAVVKDIDGLYGYELVAKSYVIVGDNDPVYVDNVELYSFSPAYVAASEINAVLSDDDQNNDTYSTVLDSYTAGIGVSYANTTVNVGVGDLVTPSFNVTGLSTAETEKLQAKLVANNGFVTDEGYANFGSYTEGKYKPLKEGESKLKATILGKIETSNNLLVNAISDKVVYANAYYTPSGDIEIPYLASEINSVELNDVTLIAGTDYTFSENVITLDKAAIASKATLLDNALAINGTEFTLNVQVGGGYTSFNTGEISDILSSTTNVGTVTVEDGEIKIPLNAGENLIYISMEYLSTLFKMPYVQNVAIQYRKDVTGNVGYRVLSSGSLIYSGMAYNIANATAKIDVLRPLYNAMVAAGENFVISLNNESPANFYIERIYVNYQFQEPYTQVIADSNLDVVIDELQGTISNVQIGGSLSSKYTATDKGIKISKGDMKAGNFRVETTLEDKTGFYFAKATVNDMIFPRYILKDVEPTTPYTYTVAEGATVYEATLDGSAVGISFENNVVSIDKAQIASGTYELNICAENLATSQLYYYYLNVAFFTSDAYSKTITFEDGNISPFVAVQGVSTVEVVDSSVMNASNNTDYKNDASYTSSSGTVQNTKVLKVVLKPGETLKFYLNAQFLKTRADVVWWSQYDWNSYTSQVMHMRLGGKQGDSNKSNTWIRNGAWHKTEDLADAPAVDMSYDSDGGLYGWAWRAPNYHDGYPALTLAGYKDLVGQESVTQSNYSEFNIVKSYSILTFKNDLTVNIELYFDDIGGTANDLKAGAWHASI